MRWPTLLTLALVALALSCGGGGDALEFSDRLILTRAEGIVELDLSSGDERVLIPLEPETFLSDPAVSPDGARLAYSVTLAPAVPQPGADFGSDLYVSGIDGADREVVLEHENANEHIRWPDWFPDGQLLVSRQALVGDAFELAVERFDELSGERNVVVVDAFRSSVSPDGSRVAYVTQDETFRESLWVANADGSDAREIVGTAEGFGSFEVPRFSPDGQTLAFGASQIVTAEGMPGPRYASSRGARAANVLNGVPMDIWTVDLAGGGEPELLDDLKLDSPSLSWSGDGQRLFILSGGGLFVIVLNEQETYRIGDGTFHGQVEWLSAAGPASG